jgi:hypothetical protein
MDYSVTILMRQIISYPLCRYGTHYYPILTYFHHEDDELYVAGGNPDRHTGKTDLQGLLEFVGSMTGVNRTKTGEYTEEFGTIPELDAVIGEAQDINEELVDKLKEVSKTLEDPPSTVDNYILFAKKIAERGIPYIDHEIARLEKLYSRDSIVSLDKKSAMNLRANVMKAFKKNFNPPYGIL